MKKLSCDDKFLSSNNFSSYSLAIKKVSPYSRGGFEINNFRKLPAIKEEDGSSSAEESETNTKSVEDTQSCLSFPSFNINCLMNVNVKQSGSIWNTNFGKRLMNDDNVSEVSSEQDEKETPIIKKINRKTENSKSTIKTKSVRNHKNDKDKKDFRQTASLKKKSKKNISENRNLKKKISFEKQPSIISSTNSEKSSEVTESIISEETSTSSINSKPQILSEYVRSIFENNPEIECEYCNEVFSDLHELCRHEKRHEIEKETCLLCDKVFYNSSKFNQHLLTHEGVDRFSCKKCMKYFPSLKKYKQHAEEVHFKPPPTIYLSPPKLDYVEKWLPKFECKRCKVELDSAKTYKGHQRAHLRKDLARAYLLNFNNI